ncbi:MAG: hypothetical protein C4324_04550 [Blastocatellia bacterium]
MFGPDCRTSAPEKNSHHRFANTRRSFLRCKAKMLGLPIFLFRPRLLQSRGRSRLELLVFELESFDTFFRRHSGIKPGPKSVQALAFVGFKTTAISLS